MTDETNKPPAEVARAPTGTGDTTLVRLQLAATAARRQIEQILRPESLGWYDFAVLRVVRKGRVELSRVAVETGMHRGTLRNVVYGLTVRNLLVRAHEPSRMVVLALTSDGQQLVDRLLVAVREVEDSMLRPLKEPQRNALKQSLHALAEHLSEPGEQTSGTDDQTMGTPERGQPNPAMPRHPATDDVVERYERGSTIRQVAGGLGLSYGKTRQILIDAGVRLRPKGRLRAEKTVARAPEKARSARRQNASREVIARYRNGEGILQIAATVGMSYGAVRGTLINEGVELRTAGGSKAERGGGPAARRERAVLEAVRRYRSGESLQTIARTLDVSVGVVRAVLTDAGIELRPPGRPRMSQPRQLGAGQEG